MSSVILFLQLLVLLALMLTGFTVYKCGIIDDHTHSKLSSLVVWVLNPSLMISGVIGKDINYSSTVVTQNIIMVSFFYFALFVTGFIFTLLAKTGKKDSYLYKLVFLFPNVGFMGVPLVKEMFGSEYIVLVAFYLVTFNIISYTYGISISAKYGGNDEKFKFKRLLNPGTVCSITAIIIFALDLNVPEPVVKYVDYLGTTSITISMIIIGISLAKVNWRHDFKSLKYYIFLVCDMIIVPIILITLSKLTGFDSAVLGIFSIMCCMPVASTTCMFTQEYAGDGTECAKLISLTTVATCISAPIVIFITSFI